MQQASAVKSVRRVGRNWLRIPLRIRRPLGVRRNSTNLPTCVYVFAERHNIQLFFARYFALCGIITAPIAGRKPADSDMVCVIVVNFFRQIELPAEYGRNTFMNCLRFHLSRSSSTGGRSK